MKRLHPLHALAALCLFSPLAAAQHTQVSSVAVNPNDSDEVWACNRGNDSVAVVDTSTGTTVAEIEVGVWPRAIAFDATGTRAFVVNQRGNVPVTKNFVTPFDGSEKRGTVSVIDVATRLVVDEIEQVGTEPYGIAFAPNGEFFVVSGFQSGTMKFYDADSPYALLTTFQYDRSLNHITPPKTVADVDENLDYIPDLKEPRGFTIRSDNQAIYVAHSLSGYVSVLDLTLDGAGLPTSVVLDARIDLNSYPFHPILTPTPVQVVLSQGFPRFGEDVALSPDGTRALVPHVLHNVNHDVNHFFPGLAGDFANRVYPALSVVDAAANSFHSLGDTSERIHHELFDPAAPAAHAPFGGQGLEIGGGILSLGGFGSPLLGGTASYRFSGGEAGDQNYLFWSQTPISAMLFIGKLHTLPESSLFLGTSTTANIPVPNDPGLDGALFRFQGLVLDSGGAIKGLTNGVKTLLGTQGIATNDMGYRAGHPGRVLYNAAGDRALMLNRGSEDVFLYEVDGSDLDFMTAFPERLEFTERTALDTGTPMGDLPLGMAMVDDPSTSNDDSLVYIINETSRTLSTLRVDWPTGVITQEASQISTLLGPDQMTLSERVGQEIFEDASRAQTTGNFNNSCASCHFEGLADGNVWQRPAGPRSTMPVYGGALGTGLILWKGVRLNMGETGPMFGGENGGTGAFGDVEQQALTDYHQIIPVPLTPNLDPVTGDYSATAALGKDLYFGTNDTGLNPTLRHAGCTACHPDTDVSMTEVRGYTNDFLNPMLTSGDNLESLDPDCFSLRPNIVAANIRNVNSGVNVDIDGMGGPDFDRNADGIGDLETYTPMNVDTDDDFTRDDPNGYMCPDAGEPGGLRIFGRGMQDFSIPTKLGVFSTGPYFHDHSIPSLRLVLDPSLVNSDPTYGHASYAGLNKFKNEFHDIRGDDTFVSNASKVQLSLMTIASGSTFDADVEALLAYIESL